MEQSIHELTPMQARQLNPLALAFIGDSIYDLYVRKELVKSEINTHKLHVAAVGYVSAHNQAAIYDAISSFLTDDEQTMYRRGRNQKGATVPKNADVQEYRSATGLECLVGYLYLSGQTARLEEIMSLIIKTGKGEI